MYKTDREGVVRVGFPKRKLGVILSSSAILAASTAMADQSYMLEEIVVTAQKRAESVQEVPIAISALSEDFIRNVGAQDSTDLGLYTPGLETRIEQATLPTFNIRGITTNAFGIGTDPAVAVYADGIYSGRMTASITAFSDVERIEVLKGPQGTLFGKNAAAGAIHVITKKPSSEFEASVDATLGNYDRRKVEGVLNIPLTDNLFLRLNAMSNERDGYRENTYVDQAVGDENNGSARATLLWGVSDDTEVVLRAEYTDIDQDSAPKSSLFSGDLYGAISLDELDNNETLELWSGSLAVETDLGSSILTSLTASKRFVSGNRVDQDGSSSILTSMTTENEEEGNFFSQEFRLVSDTDGDLKWTLGAMFSREHGTQSTSTEIPMDTLDKVFLVDDRTSFLFDIWNQFYGANSYTPATAPRGLGWDILLDVKDDRTPDLMAFWGQGLTGGTMVMDAVGTLIEKTYSEIKSTSAAIYADATYALTDQWDLTMGVRYTQDEKDFSLYLPAGNPFGITAAFPDLVDPEVSRTEEWENVSYRAVLDYALSEEAMVFLSYATGYKAGGFNSTSVTEPFEQEEVTNIELGLKSNWMDGRLRVNGSLFTYEYDGLQEVTQVYLAGDTFPTFLVRSIDSEAVGAEVEVTWLATQNLVLSANYTYVDSEITNYPLYDGEPASESREGHPQSSVAKNAYSLAAQYTWPLAEVGELDFRIDYAYSGKRENQALGVLREETQAVIDQYIDELTDGYQEISARITFSDASGKWRAALYGKNLTDEEYLYRLGGPSTAVESPSASMAMPRQYGLQVSYTY